MLPMSTLGVPKGQGRLWLVGLTSACGCQGLCHTLAAAFAQIVTSVGAPAQGLPYWRSSVGMHVASGCCI